MIVPKRGDLGYLNFYPQAGHEQGGRRPGIVLSPERFNRLTGFAIMCPITNSKKGWPFEVEIPEGLRIGGVVLVDHVKSMDWKSRKFSVITQAPDEFVEECLDRIHTFLS